MHSMAVKTDRHGRQIMTLESYRKLTLLFTYQPTEVFEIGAANAYTVLDRFSSDCVVLHHPVVSGPFANDRNLKIGLG